MTDQKKATEDAKTKQAAGDNAGSKANEGSALGEAQRKATASNAKSTEKTTPESGAAGSVSQEDLDALRADLTKAKKENESLAKQLDDVTSDRDGLAEQNKELSAANASMAQTQEKPKGENSDGDLGMSSIEFRVRGLLMAIIIKLPMAARYASDGDQLDKMVQFVNSYETGDERMVAVELIKSIGEVDMSKIASGGYQATVEAAMSVIHGEADAIRDVISSDSQQAAMERLQRATSGVVQPIVPEAARKDLSESTKRRKILDQDESGDSEQNEARNRLYQMTGSG